MTREELAQWTAINRKSLRRDPAQIPCKCSPKSQVLAVVYTDAVGQRLLWLRGRQGTDQSGNRTAAPHRAVNLTELAGSDHQSFEIVQCAHCRAAKLILIDGAGWRVFCDLDAPTHTQITP